MTGTIYVSREKTLPDIVTIRLITQLRQGGTMRQRVQRIMKARKKRDGRKGTERQKRSEKQDQQVARIGTEYRGSLAEKKRA